MLAGLCSTSVGTRPRRIQLNHSCALWSSEAKETYLLSIGKDIKTSKFWAKLLEASFRNSLATSRNICLKLWLAIVVNRWQRSFVWICREVRVRWFKILGHYLFAVPLGSRRGKASIEAAPRFGCFSWTWSACKLPPQGNNYGNNFCTVFVWTWYECVWVYTNLFFDVDLEWRYDIWKIISEYRKCDVDCLGSEVLKNLRLPQPGQVHSILAQLLVWVRWSTCIKPPTWRSQNTKMERMERYPDFKTLQNDIIR